METNITATRWELLQVSIKDGNFTILDNVTKKRRIYHVPNLLRVEVVQQAAYIFTSSARVMQLNLLTATRHFLSTSEYEGFTKTLKKHLPFQIKDVTSILRAPSLTNITNSSELAFPNTAYM